MTEEEPYFDQNPETGRIRRKYSNSAFIDAVIEHSPSSTSEVAESVGCSSDNAYRRLKKLESHGKIRSKRVGSSLVWLPANHE